jgi:hypothetical protein
MTTSKVKFDVTGTLSGSEVAVGCQRFPLADAIKAADKVAIEGTTVEATGVTLDVVEGQGDYRIVTLPNGRRMYVVDLRSHVSNLTDVAPPAPKWVDGDVCVGHGGFAPTRTGTTREIRVRERRDGVWIRTDDSDRTADRWSDAEMERNVANGGYKVAVKQSGLRVGVRVKVANPASTTADGSGYVSILAFGKTGTITSRSHMDGNWHVRADEGQGSWSQHIHENYLTVV